MAVLGGMRSFWGPLIGAAIFIVFAGLPFEPHPELDVLHRPVLRADRAVLSARRARHHPAKGGIVSLLRVENVSKHFGSLVAVNEVSMTVEPGELRAIIGPNGAGKTTFFNLISGFFRPTSGRIIFDGDDITDLLPARRVWRGVARTFQITEVFPELSVARESAHPDRSRLRLPLETLAVARGRCEGSRASRRIARNGRPCRQGHAPGGRTCSRRPARRRDHDGDRAQSPTAAA